MKTRKQLFKEIREWKKKLAVSNFEASLWRAHALRLEKKLRGEPLTEAERIIEAKFKLRRQIEGAIRMWTSPEKTDTELSH